MTTAIQSIGQVAIRARDLPAAVTFYRDVLGLEYLFEAGPLAFFMCGDVRLMLSPPEADEFEHRSDATPVQPVAVGEPEQMVGRRATVVDGGGIEQCADRAQR